MQTLCVYFHFFAKYINTFRLFIYFNYYFYRYAGDCDITFFVGNIKGGIKDFQVSILRVSIRLWKIFSAIFNKNIKISDTWIGARCYETYAAHDAINRRCTDILLECSHY